MRLYGLALYSVDEIIDWYCTREEAEAAVRAVLRDQPNFVGIVGVEQIEVKVSPN